jgi:DNA-binding transcriptional LysR family regulator
MALDVFRLLVFVAVVDRNGYSAAARHLHLAQATVSHHVRELEKELGSELLRYEQRAVHLTPAGHEVYRTARVMLREQEHLRESLRDLRRGRRGRVRLGASMAFEQRYFFERVVAPFRRAHEGVLLSLRFGHSAREAQAVLDHELDLAYVIRWHLPPDVEFEPLHDAKFTFLVPRNHPLTRKEVVTVHDIAEVGLITAPVTGLEAVYYDRVLRDCGLDGDHSVLEIDGMQARVIAAEAGLGVFGTFYPEYAGEAVAGSLVPLQLEGPSPQVEIGLVGRTGGPRAASVEALADWLRNLSSSGR